MNDLNLIIKIIRTPAAIIASVVLFAVSFIGIIVELPVAIAWLVVLSLVEKNENIKKSWVSYAPVSFRGIRASIKVFFSWAFSSNEESRAETGNEACQSCSLMRDLFHFIGALALFAVFNGWLCFLVVVVFGLKLFLDR